MNSHRPTLIPSLTWTLLGPSFTFKCWDYSWRINKVVKNLPTHKSPGPDGMPYTYHKTFLPILSPHLLSLLTSLLKGTIPHPQFLHAHITVILKPGKDPSLPNIYRPIALLNFDYKMFTKNWANWLSHILHRLIHKDQVGVGTYQTRWW